MPETATLTLSDFLRARFAEDKGLADHARWAMQGEWFVTAEDKVDEFVQHNSPARVLAECDAKRRIVEAYDSAAAVCELHGDGRQNGSRYQQAAAEVAVLLPTLALLALPYSDHPDFDEAWRP